MEFKKNREGRMVSDTHRECSNKNCREIFPITSKTVTLCNKCNSNRVKSTRSSESALLAGAKDRSKKKNIECSITIDDIIIPEFCPILNIKLERHKGKPGGNKNSPSLDRIDNSKGYTKDNIIVISLLANCMKSSANINELRQFANWINKNYPDQD